jgi:carbohydrate-selective porin OprB
VRLAYFVALQPDVQYIVNPGADPQLDDSLVFGLRVEFAWAIAR